MKVETSLPFSVETKKEIQLQAEARRIKEFGKKLNGWTVPKWKFHTGYRAEAGFKDFTGDCSVRAFSLACGEKDYLKAVKLLGVELTDKGFLPFGTPHDCYTNGYKQLGWEYHKTPKGRLTQEFIDTLPRECVLSLGASHQVYCLNGVLYDTYNCGLVLDSRNKNKKGKYNPRVIKGYYSKRR